MAIKLQDFARQQGVTERTVQKHLKKHEAELEGHFERKGPNGTWLDEYAQDFIKGHLIQSPIVVYDNEAARLKDENLELQKRLTAAYERLSNAQEYQMSLLEDLNAQKLLAAKTEEAEQARMRALNELEEARQKAQTAEDIAEAEAQEAARAKAEAEELRGKLEQIASSGRWKRKKIIKKLRKEHKAKLKEVKSEQDI